MCTLCDRSFASQSNHNLIHLGGSEIFDDCKIKGKLNRAKLCECFCLFCFVSFLRGDQFMNAYACNVEQLELETRAERTIIIQMANKNKSQLFLTLTGENKSRKKL